VPYWRLHCHLIWATRERLPLIDDLREKEIRTSIITVARKFGCYIHAIGMIENHIHIAISVPPSQRISDVIREMKGKSAFQVNLRFPDANEKFGWQNEYGALSFDDSAMEGIVKYVLNQKEHHRSGTTNARFEIDSD